MNHPWYHRAAQHVLDSAGIPDLYEPTHHGHTSATLMYSGTEGRLIIMVGTNIGGRLIDTRPAPRNTQALAAWEQARDHVSKTFTQAGCPTPRPTRIGLVLQVPEHLGTPARVTLERTGLGRYTARIDGHPDLVADIDGRMEIPTAEGFCLSTCGHHSGYFATEHAAARAFATDMGFGPQITIAS